MRGRALVVGLALLASPAAASRSGQPTPVNLSEIDPSIISLVSPAAQAMKRPRPEKGLDRPTAATKGHRHHPAPTGEQEQPTDVPSTVAWHVINWVIASHDNNDLPFMVLDKVEAELFLFDPRGQMIAAAPALVGMTKGDEATPGVGDRELSNIPPKDRKTPAGRFVAKFGHAAGGRDVLWVDYPSAISIHAVITIKNQHRLERLNSRTPKDNRITYGCINVPTKFYADVIKPLLKDTSGIVYVLPETRPAGAVFLAMPPPSTG
ncbi:MAG TPA: hypothetical protein VK192_11460 [Sphingomicrobium sp.]|nr:hypothetical protein [Sphingomicrobium sp.]